MSKTLKTDEPPLRGDQPPPNDDGRPHLVPEDGPPGNVVDLATKTGWQPWQIDGEPE